MEKKQKQQQQQKKQKQNKMYASPMTRFSVAPRVSRIIDVDDKGGLPYLFVTSAVDGEDSRNIEVYNSPPPRALAIFHEITDKISLSRLLTHHLDILDLGFTNLDGWWVPFFQDNNNLKYIELHDVTFVPEVGFLILSSHSLEALRIQQIVVTPLPLISSITSSSITEIIFNEASLTNDCLSMLVYVLVENRCAEVLEHLELENNPISDMSVLDKLFQHSPRLQYLSISSSLDTCIVGENFVNAILALPSLVTLYVGDGSVFIPQDIIRVCWIHHSLRYVAFYSELGQICRDIITFRRITSKPIITAFSFLQRRLPLEILKLIYVTITTE